MSSFALSVAWRETQAFFFTGRAREEATLGLERLGLDLPPERVVCDTSPRFRKPRPDGLLALASAMNSRRPLYVGDTVDDMAAAWNAREAGLQVSFAGVAGVGSERARRFTEGGAIAVRDSLRTILSDLGLRSTVPRPHGSGGVT